MGEIGKFLKENAIYMILLVFSIICFMLAGYYRVIRYDKKVNYASYDRLIQDIVSDKTDIILDYKVNIPPGCGIHLRRGQTLHIASPDIIQDKMEDIHGNYYIWWSKNVPK